MEAVIPLPIREDWAPGWLRPRGDANRDFAFRFVDAQGAPDKSGTRRHSAVDWFAPGGHEVRAPQAGRISRASASRGNSGSVYGGTIGIETPGGLVWTIRHVDPKVPLGREVRAGEVVATVTRWADVPAASHAHVEIWRNAAGGYRHENMLDPAAVAWVDGVSLADALPEPAKYYVEEVPARFGGNGPDVVNSYGRLVAARARAALRRMWGERVSVLAADDGRFYVLRWRAGTHGQRFRFGPWADADARRRVAEERHENTGRVMRPYNGRAASLYPYPKES